MQLYIKKMIDGLALLNDSLSYFPFVSDQKMPFFPQKAKMKFKMKFES